MKHLNVRVLLANAVKSGRWVSHTFLQTPCFFSVFQHLRRKLCCRHHLLALLLANAVKRSRWVSYTFLQKRCSFKSFSILEENCAADIINEAFKCKTFVGKYCKKRPLSKSYLPTKALFFFGFSAFYKKIVSPTSITEHLPEVSKWSWTPPHHGGGGPLASPLEVIKKSQTEIWGVPPPPSWCVCGGSNFIYWPPVTPPILYQEYDSIITVFDRGYPIENVQKWLKIHCFR